MLLEEQQANELASRIDENLAKIFHLAKLLIEARNTESAAKSRHSRRHLQRVLRYPAGNYDLWPIGVVLVGSLFFGGLAFTFVQIATGSFGWAFGTFLLVAVSVATGLAWLLFVPSDEQLEMLVSNYSLQLQSAQDAVRGLQVEISNLNYSIRKDTEARYAILRSVQYQRSRLLQENWKEMRGPEWEDFLVRVFQTLGAEVQPTGTSGDQGVDLIAEIGPRRYAIQAKGYISSVGNGAVQEAVAGMAHYRCNACVVITNSRFTAGAIALAASNRCMLIGEDEIPDLVRGNLSL